MQDFDSFILPILGFEGDVLIPAIPILACDLGAEPSEDPPTGSSASTPRTRAYKRKAHIDPNPPKKAREIVEKPLGGLKITGPKSKTLALTPAPRTQKGIPILQSKRYIHHKSSLFYHSSLICGLPCRVPQDIPSSSPTRDIQLEGESLKVDKPLSPSARKTPLKTPNHPGLEGTHVPSNPTSNPTSPPTGDSQRDATRQSPRPDPSRHQDTPPISLSHLDSGHMVDNIR
jgi:hypothetical protein